MTLHASALLNFQSVVRAILRQRLVTTNIYPQADISKVIEIRDGPEYLTKDVIDAQLLSS